MKVKTKLNKGTLSKVLDLRKEMGANPYTVFQNMELTVLKPYYYPDLKDFSSLQIQVLFRKLFDFLEICGVLFASILTYVK